MSRARTIVVVVTVAALALTAGMIFDLDDDVRDQLGFAPEVIDLDSSANSNSVTMSTAGELAARCERIQHTDCGTAIAAICWGEINFEPEVCIATPGAPTYERLDLLDRTARLSPEGDLIMVNDVVRRVDDGTIAAEPVMEGASDLSWFGRTGNVIQELDDEWFVSSLDGTIVDQFPAGPNRAPNAIVTADGMKIVALPERAGPSMQIFDQTDRTWRTLVDHPGVRYLAISPPAFSADGATLYASRLVEEEGVVERPLFELVAIDVASGSVEVIQAFRARIVLTSISPDGNQVAVYAGAGQLRVLDLGSGRLSAPTAVCCGQDALSWSPNGDFLVSREGGLVAVEGGDDPVLVGPFSVRVEPTWDDPWVTSFAWP